MRLILKKWKLFPMRKLWVARSLFQLCHHIYFLWSRKEQPNWLAASCPIKVSGWSLHQLSFFVYNIFHYAQLIDAVDNWKKQCKTKRRTRQFSQRDVKFCSGPNWILSFPIKRDPKLLYLHVQHWFNEIFEMKTHLTLG